MGSSYSYINQLFFTKSAIRSTIAEDHLNLDDRMKSLISSDTFWNDLGKIQNFLENFAIFIKKLEGDKTFLSTAYFEYQQLKAYVRNNTDLPENIRKEVEKFGTNRCCLNTRIFDPIIEKETLSLVGEEYKNIVLTKLAKYVGKTGTGRKIVYMFWNLQILRSLEKPLTIEGWVEKVLQKKAIREAAKGNNEQEIDVESDFSDLDFQSYSDLEGLLDEELNEFQD
ncbi:hypothetical protein RhiirA1_398094 [Rhizophagus irregularis]|uniref:Uncharacterized protein n=1 Tax=Rhizophagus irregularis TaxID=588596 RepID=A0A2N0REW5_9GLOM|nr:hypothetical protein RhiirA1_398094 [Rhizophagus irregularis]